MISPLQIATDGYISLAPLSIASNGYLSSQLEPNQVQLSSTASISVDLYGNDGNIKFMLGQEAIEIDSIGVLSKQNPAYLEGVASINVSVILSDIDKNIPPSDYNKISIKKRKPIE